VRTLGVLLPTSNDDLSLTQALFNGVRIAVDAHNASGDGSSLIRIVFRRSDRRNYDELMSEFASLDVAAVLGPLYSQEAVDAARSAERNGVVLITPLATDEGVTLEREFVFQANPTATMRGRAIARFAVENLRHSQLGVIAEYGNALSERMAEGFEDEALRLGADMRFVMMLPSATAWFRLGDRIVRDSLAGVQAIYLPITGGQARSLIKAAMDEFDNLDLALRLLGNKEWNDLPSKSQPSRYNAVYTNDFHVSAGDSRVVVFDREYELLAQAQPNELAYVGYDLAQYVIYLVTAGSDRPLNEALRAAPPYNGLALRLDFRAGNVNSAMFFERYRNGQSELLY
jgi:ABC-type branched-subunit amino acid transport system substrate-binding protein